MQFTEEQQKAVDKLIADRLKRAQQKWQDEQKTKAAADTDAADTAQGRAEVARVGAQTRGQGD